MIRIGGAFLLVLTGLLLALAGAGSAVRPSIGPKSKVEVLGEVLKRHVAALRRAANKQVELVFLVDSSASVGAANFFNELKFVKKLLADFTVAFNQTRVAVITFSSKTRVIRHIDHLSRASPSNHKCALQQEELPKIKYTGGGTYTLGALLEAQRVLESARPKAAKAVFLITDGYSNGGDPRPAARVLRAKGVTLFTFGIRNGNVRELYEMASEPQAEHSYILDSFEEFEALARRALHEDLHTGSYLPQNPEACSKLCDSSGSCCDSLATCTCGTHTGHYACLCKPGYYGTGLAGDCKACPAGTFRNSTDPGDLSSCTPCPDINQNSEPGSSSVDQCICKRGFHRKGHKCRVTECPQLKPPQNGYFVKNICNRVFNAACGIRCNTGYKLEGSSIRLCGEDGTWSGENAKCVMRNCPPLKAPKHGKMHCTKDTFEFDTECHFSCDPGYAIVGSKKRSCLAVALWDGLPSHCRLITCSSLTPLPYGSVSPSRCTNQKAQYGDVCNFTCDPGFVIQGPDGRQCIDPGVWSLEEKKTQCIDVMPPMIKCPDNIVINAEENENSASVKWELPIVTDNSKESPSLTVVPAITVPMRFRLGTSTITYRVEDRAKNKAQCSFNITVIDTQPPMIDRCISPPVFLSRDKVVEVTWDEPLFSDNSGGEVYVKQSHQPGLFTIGETKVIYEAVDESGNNSTCVITITIQEHACSLPADPINGLTNCSEADVAVYCSLTCTEGYAFANRPPVNYFCAYDGVWLPSENLPWPDCSVTKISNSIVQTGIISLESETTLCDDAFFLNQLEHHVMRKITNQVQYYCPDNVICDVNDIVAACETLMTELVKAFSRKKRSLSKKKLKSHKLRHWTSFSRSQRKLWNSKRIASTSVPNRGDIPLDSNENKTAEGFIFGGTDSNAEGFILSNQYGAGHADTLLLSQYPFETNGYILGEDYDDAWDQSKMAKSSFTEQEGTQAGVDLQFQMTGVMSGPWVDQNLLVTGMKDVVRGLQEAGEKGLLDVTLGTTHLTYKHLRVLEEDPNFVCDAGSVAVGSECVKCPLGTYYNVLSELCVPCEKGSYQFDEGQLTCLICPQNTSTSHEQSKSPGECKAQCLPGSYSPDGLEVCETCDLGSYQSEYAQTTCLKCPDNTTTWRRGARRIEECREPCPAGSVSETGLVPCFPCPIGYYQHLFGQKGCFKCPNGGLTQNSGTVNPHDCPGFEEHITRYPYSQPETLSVNECFSVPCLNGATCFALEFGYICACPPEFTGTFCEQEVNECDNAPCQNDATCIDHLNGFECRCLPGFTGVSCESDLDECESYPCLNNGICIDQINGFLCKCPVGYQGYYCEIDINECAGSPCSNNATCMDLIAAYSCVCLPGFVGVNCDVNLDECESHPCLNNGSCIDEINGFSCLCPKGFLGSQCEINIDECNSSPCQNGASCIDGVGRFHCNCLPSFSGHTCETELSPEFFLHFPLAGIMDHVQVDGFSHDLFQVTVCFWMRSEDKTNYGTPISYATKEQDNVLTLTDYNGFVLYVNGEKVITDITANDGEWHMLCLTWNSWGGQWNIYMDGNVVDGGDGLAKGSLLSGDGVLILGQEQDSRGGGFSTAESFIGQMALLNIWDQVLDATAIFNLSRTCDRYKGNMYAWPDFLKGLKGRVQVQEYTFCKGCLKLEPPNYGSLSMSGTHSGSVATYGCDPGYRLQGLSSRLCMVHGDWSGSAPSCNRLNCGFPGYLINGYINGKTYNFGDVIEYVCSEGYKLYGTPTRVCQYTGHWSGEPPICEEIYCDDPPSVIHGEVVTVLTSFRPNDKVEYKCDDGYALEGPDTLTCLGEGQWDKGSPVCHPRNCSNIPVVSNGYVVSDHKSVPIGGKVTYACNPGYRLNGSADLFCSFLNKWNGSIPQCQPVDCGKPLPIAHGSVSFASTQYNERANYNCDEGYKLEGNSTLTCILDGLWSPDRPICRIINCHELSKPRHGNVYGDRRTFGSVIHYSCDAGYQLEGDRSRQCLSNGSWTGTTPVCVKVNCANPEDIPNGFINDVPPWVANDVVTYMCNPGYIIVGNASRICLNNGSWSQGIPVCTPVKCSPPEDITNGIVVGDVFLFGYSVEYRCNEGYKLHGNSERICTENETWSQPPPECIIISCGSLSNIDEGYIVVSAFTYQSVVEYFCNKGFQLKGNKIRTCQSDGSWSNDEPTCSVINCGDPPLPNHGIAKYNSTSFGNKVDYECERGFVPEGILQQFCEGNGKWSGEVPQCVSVICSEPDPIADGYINIVDLQFGSQIEYGCEMGFQLDGPNQRKCESDGQWSGDMNPICFPLECPQKKDVFENGRIIGNSRRIGASLQYECDPGFHLVGFPVQTCLPNKTWDKPTPTCQRISCPRPETIPNGNVIFTNITFEAIITYSCNKGFEISGRATRLCLDNGSWQESQPTCILVKCPEPISPDHGHIIFKGNSFKDSVNFFCDEGYELLGEKKLTCLENRSWSGEVPSCVPIQCPQPSSPSNGLVRKHELHIGAQVEFSCENGFQLQGEKFSTCVLPGVWNTSVPHCEKIKCPKPSVLQNGRVKSSNDNYEFGTIIRYICDPGFEILGEIMAECLTTGFWNVDLPLCVKIQCPPLNHLSNGTLSIPDRKYGSVVEANCDPGFVLKGPQRRHCLSNATWSHEDWQCDPIQCPDPPMVWHAKMVGKDYYFQKNVTYICDEGYHINGSDILICSSNGTWDKDPPACNIVYCPPLEIPMHGNVIFEKYYVSTADDLIEKMEKRQGSKDTSTGQLELDHIPIGYHRQGSKARYECHEGYELNGSEFRQCNSSGNWIGKPAICKPVECRPPPLLSNGFIRNLNNSSSHKYPFGCKINYACKDGYRLFGSSFRECLANRSWSNHNISCEQVVCPQPSPLFFGSFLVKDVKYGSEIIAQCDPGYKLVGGTKRICQGNGTWSNTNILCKAIECTDPAPPQNGTVIVDSLLVGGTATYACNPGFLLVGSNVITCLDPGNWSEPAPACHLIICPQVEPVLYSSIESNGWTLGSIVEYKCNAGHVLRGQSIRTCLHNGTWSSKEPYCERIYCTQPEPILYGQIIGKDYSVGSSIHYICDEGYEILGSTSQTCKVDRNWTNDVPQCIPVSCPPITEIVHGEVIGDEFAYDDILLFICHDGFELMGEMELRCQADKKWSHPIPLCQKEYCPVPESVRHADTIGSSFAVDATIEFVCHDGYSLKGQNSMTCISGGVWNGTTPICEVISCGLPPIVPNSRTHFVTPGPNAYSYGSAAFYTCEDGYELHGDHALLCQQNSAWTGPPPSCEKVSCGPPPIIEFATVHVENHEHVSKALYQCNPGFRMLGNAFLDCHPGEDWGAEGTLCIPIQCGEPPSIRNGHITARSYEYHQLANYSCQPGFRLVGDTSLVCGSEGHWLGRTPSCHPVICVPPEIPLHATVEGDDFSYQSAVIYTCRRGYSLHGNDIRFCQADGTWSGNPPACLSVQCEEVNPPRHGLVMVENRRVGDVAKFTCKLGYSLIGESQIRCLPTGEWNAPVPKCIVVTCSPPPIPVNAVDFGYEEPFTAGDRITYVCQDGFRPSASMSVTCLSDGTWTEPAGGCMRAACGRPRTNNGAVILGMSYNYKVKLMFACPPGKKPKGSSLLSCLPDGSWDHDASCEGLCPRSCLNGGICVRPGMCSCPAGYVGERCQIPVCILPCLNGGTCIGSFKCSCRRGYIGSRCEKPHCKPSCENGGRCIGPNLCQCPVGFNRPYCRTRGLSGYHW